MMTEAEPAFTRRSLIAGAAASTPALFLPLGGASVSAASLPRIHRFDQRVPFPVNAFVVEGDDELVVIDATLTETASKGLRAMADGLGKPIAAVLLTHPHPDHYAGLGNLVAGLDTPIVSVDGVRVAAKRDDSAKNEMIGAMFGPEWPSRRVFPSDTVKDGDVLRFGAMRFEVRDIGPAESHHDSMFVLEGPAPRVFAGDVAHSLMHAFMADNHNPEWKRALEMIASELPEDAVLHVGHGPAVTPSFLRWQSTYLDVFEAALRDADWGDAGAAQDAVMRSMRRYLPGEELLFLMQLSILPNAERLGLIRSMGAPR